MRNVLYDLLFMFVGDVITDIFPLDISILSYIYQFMISK